MGLLLSLLVGNGILKPLVGRLRPFEIREGIELIIKAPGGYSFPSGHTVSSVVGATVLTRANKKFGYVAIPLAVLIAFSRMYLFVHFPTDILAGAVLGFAIGFAVVSVGNRLINKIKLSKKKETNEN